MKSLVEHMAEQNDLEERLLRTGAIAAYGAKARNEGDASVRAFKQGQQALRTGGADVGLEDRVKRVEQSLDHLLHTRQQSTASVHAVSEEGTQSSEQCCKRRVPRQILTSLISYKK